MVEKLFPYLEKFYRDIQKESNRNFFSERVLYRPFSSAEELNDWYGRSSLSNYRKFIIQICDPGAHSGFVHDPHGGVEILSYVLNASVFLAAVRALLDDKCAFLNERFDEEKLEILSGGVRYENIEARQIVYCTGHEITASKYFGWLPMAPLKGEILHLKMETEFQTIYNRLCFIIPQENGVCKVGSTYDRHHLTDEITESGKDEICKKLEALSFMSYKVVGQEAGIRPATIARRPLIGTHPKYDRMHVFNGLGAKGVSLAPFFSEQLVKCLEEGNNVDVEVDIKKYYSLYFNSHFYIES